VQKTKVEEMLAEIIKLGVGQRATPKKLIVSPTMFKAAKMILETRGGNSHEIKVDFHD
jgi:hypothetical protein